MNFKQKLTETVEFAKTHPREIISFSAGVATVVAYNVLKDANKTTLVMKRKEYENVAQGLGIFAFDDKAFGDTVLIARKYINKQ